MRWHRWEMAGPVDREWVIDRLEHAGKVMLALPDKGPSTSMRSNSLETMEAASEAAEERDLARSWRPSPRDIALADEVFPGWMAHITHADAEFQRKLRRVVLLRCQVRPVTDRHVYRWRRIGDMFRTSEASVRSWHGIAIARLVSGLNREMRMAA